MKGTMPAYLISICKGVNDRSRLESYWASVKPSFEGYDAKPLAAYTPFEFLEGNAAAKGVVLFEFPSIQVAKRWYNSVGYQKMRELRKGAADFDLILVEGGFTAPSERMPNER